VYEGERQPCAASTDDWLMFHHTALITVMKCRERWQWHRALKNHDKTATAVSF
jgi:hypothetical protein